MNLTDTEISLLSALVAQYTISLAAASKRPDLTEAERISKKLTEWRVAA